MTKRKIYPLNPIFETATRDGQRAWVAFYAEHDGGRWLGRSDDGHPEAWHADGHHVHVSNFSLTTLPEIPAEVREPKPGEVWMAVEGFPVLLIKCNSGHVMEALRSNLVSYRMEKSGLSHPWPSDRPHGFEGLVNAILQAHGEKT